ncbi:MAG: hypothetical protein GF308_02600 [Candidatus Heimdallarchaeota archaeon]|nr:hypothetical protein [Candidatus Heimdallarchaeota archaeon]
MNNQKTTQSEETRTSAITCTWDETANCASCEIKEKLDCKWEMKLLLRFFFLFAPALSLVFGAIIYAAVFIGDWWWLGVVLGYFALFFIVETRILCSHCPYYSEEGLVLHCLANHGFIKFYRYHPEPMSKVEKILLIIGFLFFALVPLGAQVYNIIIVGLSRESYSQTFFLVLLVLFGLSIVSIAIGFILLFTRICPKCVNFSCPWNSVPKEIVDDYLTKNPVMKKAWIEADYKLE